MKHLLALIFCVYFSGSLMGQQQTEWGNWKNWGDQEDGTYLNPIIPSDYSDMVKTIMQYPPPSSSLRE